jgi:hypothetical protein
MTQDELREAQEMEALWDARQRELDAMHEEQLDSEENHLEWKREASQELRDLCDF